MSFLAKLTLGENSYIVLNADYEVSQPIGRRNMPTDAPVVGLIHITLESNNRSEIFEWAVSPKLAKSGNIVFYRRDAQSSMKTLSFKDGFCISFREQFEADSEKPMRMHITLAVREISCQGVMLASDWPGFENEGSSGGGGGGGGNANSPAPASQSGDNSSIPSFIP